MSEHDRDEDDVARLLRLHQRAIRRGARWWVEAVERFQSGDLQPSSWIEAGSRLAGEVLDDLREASSTWPPAGRDGRPPGGRDGRRS